MAKDQAITFTGNFTRPANTTAYAAEDAMNDGTTEIQLTYDKSVQGIDDLSTVFIKTVKVVKNSNTTTNASFRLVLRNASQTAIADNSPQTLLFTNKAKRQVNVDMVMTTGGTGSDCAEAIIIDVNQAIRLTSSTIYCDLIAKAAYTPTSGEQFYIEVTGILIET